MLGKLKKAIVAVGITLAVVTNADAAILRYVLRPLDSSADPDARIPQVIIADTAAECPASDVGDGDLCYAKDTDRVRIYANSAWANILHGTVGDAEIAAGAVDGGAGGEIADGSLTTDDLGADSVSADELNAAGVESELEAVLDKDDLQGNLTLAGDVDGAHGANDLDEVAVEAELEAVVDIPDLQGQVQDAQIAAGAVDGGNAGEIADGSLTTDDLGTDSVSADELNATGVETELEAELDLPQLQGQITDGQIADSAVDGGTGGEIEDNTITAADLGVNSVGASELDENNVESVLEGVLDKADLQGTWAPINIRICPAGVAAVANQCQAYSNLGAGFSTAPSGTIQWAELAPTSGTHFTQFRLSVTMTTVAVTGDFVVQCDTDVTFGSPATLGTLANVTATGNVGTWTNLPANECTTADGVYLRPGMSGGDGAEDPVIRNGILELR